MALSHKDNTRHVNHLLHTLRGEQFRHSQNLLRSRAHLTPARVTQLPTLPTNLFENDYSFSNHDFTSVVSVTPPPLSYAGPEPPKSWPQASKKDVSLKETAEWRKEALSLIFENLETSKGILSSQIPSLSLLCLQQLVSACTASEFKDSVVPYIPSHLRRDLIRYMSVESPLPNSKLYALFEPDGNADGEIIVIGPKASLRDDNSLQGYMGVKSVGNIRQTLDWDEETAIQKFLESLVLISARISISTFLTLPPTLTHLALIDIPNSIPIHRLPSVCPLLEVLDLSYNQWLTNISKDVMNTLVRIDWTRWASLRILGVRNCEIPEEVLQRVNMNRWDDVLIVRKPCSM